jgi:tetratricopeptide (TPR) repeat protein
VPSDSDHALWAAGLVAIALLGFALYAPVLDAPFYYDDYQNIVDNPHLRWTELRADALLPTAFEGPTRRPVAYLSFALSYYAGGPGPSGFRIVNVVVHLIASMLVAGLALSLTLRLPHAPEPRVARWVALFAGLVFVAHPLQTQTVTYLVQRMNGLAALLCLLSLAAWLRGRGAGGGVRAGWWSAATLAWLLAMGSKEVAIALPAGIWLCEWIFLRGGDALYLRRSLRIGIPALLIGGVALYAFVLPAIGLGYDGRPFTAVERFLTELRVVVFYLGVALAPLPGRLNLLHEFPLSHSLLDPPATLWCGLVLVVMTLLVPLLARRAPPLAFGIAWFLGFLAVESFGLPLALVYEHRSYLPMLGFSFAAAWALFAVARSRVGGAIALGAIVVSLLAVGTLVRNHVWADELRFWSDTAAKSPGHAGAQNNFGKALMRAGQAEQAMARFEAALEIDPDEIEARNNLGSLLRETGRVADAVAQFEAVLERAPQHVGARHNLAMTRAEMGRIEAGLAELEAILSTSPRIAHVWNSYGALLFQSDRLEEAAQAFATAVSLDPGDRPAASNLEKVRGLLRAASDSPSSSIR